MANYEKRLIIKDLAANDRPREKLLLHGRSNLSDAELIAILIGTGTSTETSVALSQRILSSFDNGLQELGSASVQELCRFHGVGEAKAVSIIAALELGRRRKSILSIDSPKICSSRDVYEVMHPVLADLDHEEFWVLILNAANMVKSKVLISRGGLTGTVADPKIIFRAAIDNKAAYVILAHNHPSGNTDPSKEDIAITKKLIAAGKSLDLLVLDHLIITSDSFSSMADLGII
jgi:DNA repair protein RadC